MKKSRNHNARIQLEKLQSGLTDSLEGKIVDRVWLPERDEFSIRFTDGVILYVDYIPGTDRNVQVTLLHGTPPESRPTGEKMTVRRLSAGLGLMPQYDRGKR